MKKWLLLLLCGTASAATLPSISTELSKSGKVRVERTPDLIRFFMVFPDTGEETVIVLDGDGLTGKPAHQYNFTYSGFAFDASTYGLGYLLAIADKCLSGTLTQAAGQFVETSIRNGVNQGQGVYVKTFGKSTLRVAASGYANGRFRYTVSLTAPKSTAHCTF